MRGDNTSFIAKERKEALRASLVFITPRKWKLIRFFEAFLRPLKVLLPKPLPLEGSAETPARVLVVEYWNLGDLAILVPFLRNLRSNFPRARISLLLNANLARFLEGQGLVDEFIPGRVPWARHFHRWRKYNPFSLDWISLVRTILALRKRRFDWAFSGRMDVRDNFLLWLSGARRRIGFSIGGGGFFLTDRIKPDSSRPHRVDLWLQLLEALRILPSTELGSFRLTSADSALAKGFLDERGISPGAFLVGVHPGARIATRRWGEDRFAEVARRLQKETDVHILWFSEHGNPIQPPRMERCHAVSLDFGGFLAVLSLCQLLICNDSGPMHLANLLGVPLVAVFGPQKPEWFGPRGRHDRVVIRQEFSCRPCWDYCVFDQPYCLRAISVDEVYEAVTSQMKQILKSEQTRVSAPDKVELASHV